MRRRRIAALTLAFVAAACTAQVAAPRSTGPAPLASPRLSAVPDAVYVRQAGNGTPTYLTRIDVASGMVDGALPDGILSPDRSTLYWVESVDGATRTRIHELDVGTGRERRAFTVDGDWIVQSSEDGPFGVSADGDWMVLSRRVDKVNGSWITGFAVIDLRSGAVKATSRNEGSVMDVVTAIAPHGDAVAVTQQAGDEPARVRIWDVRTRDFAADARPGPAGWDGLRPGAHVSALQTADGTRLYLLDTGNANAGPYLGIVDFATGQLLRLELPAAQRSVSYEKFLLWTLALSPDGSSVYAANAALGYVDEIDTRSLVLRRSTQLALSGVTSDTLARLRQALLPVAEAKRSIRGGALISSDGRRLYVPGTKGIAVIDLATLRLASVWAGDVAFDSLALSPDGARLYAIDDQNGGIDVVRTSDGTQLGVFRPQLYAIDLAVIHRADPSLILAPAPPARCGAYAPPDARAPAEIHHLKTSAAVLQVLSPCAIRARIAGGSGTLAKFTGREIVLRATGDTTFASASEGDLDAIGKMGLRPGETFTLSFDARAFPDGSYPLNFMDR